MITSKLYSLMALVGLSAAVAMGGLGCEACGAPKTQKAAACAPAAAAQPSCAAPESAGVGAQPGGYYQSTGASGGTMDTGTSGSAPGAGGTMTPDSSGGMDTGAGSSGSSSGGGM